MFQIQPRDLRCYEQFKVLEHLQDGEVREAFSVKMAADCSLEELYQLGDWRLIQLTPNDAQSRLEAQITELGQQLLDKAAEELPHLNLKVRPWIEIVPEVIEAVGRQTVTIVKEVRRRQPVSPLMAGRNLAEWTPE